MSGVKKAAEELRIESLDEVLDKVDPDSDDEEEES